MKRVRVAPGKFVTISAEMAEKVARVFATGLTREQVRDLIAAEPRHATGLLIGSSKPLALARARCSATPVEKISSPAPQDLPAEEACAPLVEAGPTSDGPSTLDGPPKGRSC